MFKNLLRNTARVLVTLLIVAAAVYFGRLLWIDYMEKPWTRDGRVRATIVTIAPDVSGAITKLDLKDNQPVRKGDILFTIDREHYKLAFEQARIAVATALTNIKTAQTNIKSAQTNITTEQANLKTARDNAAHLHRELERRRALIDGGAGTQEDFERAENSALAADNTITTSENAVATAENAAAAAENAAIAAESAHQQALVSLASARLNLDRTEVRSPVNGYITNLQIDVGDYATAGKAMLAIVDSDSLYVAGYFEETKLRYIREGAPVTIKLMGYDDPVLGRVESIAPAIVDRDNTAGTDLVADVNPTFAWVRLAQRIPVRVAIEKVPASVRLTAGMTATIIVEEPKKKAGIP